MNFNVDMNVFFNEQEQSSIHDKILNKIIKEKGGKKTKTQEKDSDDKSEDSETNKKMYAVNKVSKCHDFVTDFIKLSGKDNEDNEYCPTDILNAMTFYVKNERTHNNEKLTEGMPDGKSFNVYGDMKEFIGNIINIVKQDKVLIETKICEIKKLNPSEGSKEEKLISNLEASIEKLNSLCEMPEVSQFTKFFTYRSFCCIDRNVIEKASRAPPSNKKATK